MKVRKTYQFDSTDITAREASVDDMTAAFRLVGLVTIKSGMKVVDGAGGGLFKSVKFVLEGEPEDFEALEAWVESQEEAWYDFMWMAGALARTPSVIGGAVESFKNLAATCKNNINAMAAFAQTQGDTVQERAKRRPVKPRRVGPWTQHGTDGGTHDT